MPLFAVCMHRSRTFIIAVRLFFSDKTPIKKDTEYSTLQQLASPLYGNSHAMESRSVTGPQLKMVLDLATPEGCKAELSKLAWLHTEVVTSPKTVTHPSTNRAQRRVTWIVHATTVATTTPNRQ